MPLKDFKAIHTSIPTSSKACSKIVFTPFKMCAT